MPKVVKSVKRQTILQVYAFCEKEKTENKLIIPLQQVRARVAAMTDVSESTVTRILRQERESSSVSGVPGPSKVTTPGKTRPNRDKKIKIDDFDASAIRQKIMSFYAIRKEIPTLNKLLVELREEINFEVCKNVGSQSLKKVHWSEIMVWVGDG
ncbi:uncharacterized protein LOC123659896 [Melitaea cinxia]|uniref:uncharacterized protein LOC123659896 n=1 Tax=Melitaea cinxia TaxID=113334 RepID=UPI001E27286B|nr:uncharacterized protein LOC123659896 [Melitaea cinxia]